MRVGLVIEQFDPAAGGAERSTAQIAQELAARGHTVTIITGKTPPAPLLEPDAVAPGVSIHVTGRGGLPGAAGLMTFAKRVERHLQAGPYDTTLSVTAAAAGHVMQLRAGVMRELQQRAVAQRQTAAAKGFKQAMLALNLKQQALLRLERKNLTHPRVRRIVAISRYMHDQLTRHYAIDPSRITLIPNAAAMPQLDPSRKSLIRNYMRQQMGVPEGHTAFLFAAMNPRRKGLLPLLQAAQLAQQTRRDFAVLLATPLKFAYQKAAQQLKIRDRIRFLGLTDRMDLLYPAADVTVLPTYYDPASKVVIESLMMGTPVITTRYNGSADFITPVAPADPGEETGTSTGGTGGTGGAGGAGGWGGRVIGEPDDLPALAQAMLDLMDADQRSACQAATAGMAEKLSMKQHVDALERVLSDACQ